MWMRRGSQTHANWGTCCRQRSRGRKAWGQQQPWCLRDRAHPRVGAGVISGGSWAEGLCHPFQVMSFHQHFDLVLGVGVCASASWRYFLLFGSLSCFPFLGTSPGVHQVFTWAPWPTGRWGLDLGLHWWARYSFVATGSRDQWDSEAWAVNDGEGSTVLLSLMPHRLTIAALTACWSLSETQTLQGVLPRQTQTESVT